MRRKWEGACAAVRRRDTRRALREVHRVLADGGEMHFSDVYCDRRLPAAARADPLLVGEMKPLRLTGVNAFGLMEAEEMGILV